MSSVIVIPFIIRPPLWDMLPVLNRIHREEQDSNTIWFNFRNETKLSEAYEMLQACGLDAILDDDLTGLMIAYFFVVSPVKVMSSRERILLNRSSVKPVV